MKKNYKKGDQKNKYSMPHEKLDYPASLFLPPTTDDVTAVVLVTVAYVQQQVGAVGVGPVSQLADRNLTHRPPAVPVEVQLSHPADDAVRGQRLVTFVFQFSLFPFLAPNW